MKPFRLAVLLFGAGLSGLAPSASAAVEPPAQALPPAARGPVHFAREIKPLLEASCIKCHAHGQKKGAFQVDSRELFLKGGETGPGAKSGQSAESLVVRLVAGLDPDKVMPQKGSRWTPEQIGLLRAWIDQGLPWDEGVKLGRGPQAPLAPRHVELPPARGGLKHPVDRLLQPYFAKHSLKPAAVVDDQVFARRAYLDVTGLLPAPEELKGFLADRRREKRERLVKQLLANNQRYAEHWLTFWNDALRNDYRGTGYIDGGRKQITAWLYSALATNLPYDQFVARLVNPDEHSEGFTKGIVWRGAVNASQTPPIQAAQGIGQVFLGLNLKCASCHDSFISDWKLADAYGLASIYATEPLELVRCDKATGQTATRKFLYPELGALAESTNRAVRLESLARIITNQGNGRLTRTIVNRLWAKLMGRGLVEPVDEMDNPPWNADLLDWLAVDLAAHGYDVKHTLELILTSRAYQLPAVGQEEQNQDRFVFRGPVVRRLTAEQYQDALGTMTGLWRTLPANPEVDFELANEKARAPTPPASWLWTSADAAKAVPPQTIYLRKAIQLPEAPGEAVAVATADNRFTLYINGKEAGSSDKWERPRVMDIRSFLVRGENVFAVSAANDAPSKEDQSPNPAGFFFLARLRPAGGSAAGNHAPSSPHNRGPSSSHHTIGQAPGAGTITWDFGSDASWLSSTNKTEGWQKSDFKAEGWRPAVELGSPNLGPWNLAARFAAAWSSAAQYGKVRAGLSNNDPLMAALGRSNREQIMTARPSGATTLQALELTNGATLAEFLERGAEKLMGDKAAPGRELIERLYAQALGRKPTAAERKLAAELVGQPARREGVEDLLWSVTMLPEFQLIY